VYAIWPVATEVKLAVDITAVTHFGSANGTEAYAAVFCELNDMEIFNVGVVDVLFGFVCHGWTAFSE